jgi:hypothetical protein
MSCLISIVNGNLLIVFNPLKHNNGKIFFVPVVPFLDSTVRFITLIHKLCPTAWLNVHLGIQPICILAPHALAPPSSPHYDHNDSSLLNAPQGSHKETLAIYQRCSDDKLILMQGLEFCLAGFALGLLATCFP